MTVTEAESRWCKICGITNVDDGRAVVRAGANAYGLNFYPPSPRALSVERAAEIARSVDEITRVGLFVNPSEREVRGVLDSMALDMLQFQGDETPDFCAQFELPYLKVIRMRPEVAFAEAADGHVPWAFLLDAYVENVPGGTGMAFDWALWPENADTRLILAGGLNVDNVADAVRATDPFGVDVCGGVEASKGIKNHTLVTRFVAEAKSV